MPILTFRTSERFPFIIGGCDQWVAGELQQDRWFIQIIQPAAAQRRHGSDSLGRLSGVSLCCSLRRSQKAHRVSRSFFATQPVSAVRFPPWPLTESTACDKTAWATIRN